MMEISKPLNELAALRPLRPQIALSTTTSLLAAASRSLSLSNSPHQLASRSALRLAVRGWLGLSDPTSLTWRRSRSAGAPTSTP